MRHAIRRSLGRVLLLMLLAGAGLLAYEHIVQAKIVELSQRLSLLRQEQQEKEREIARLRTEARTLQTIVQEARAAAERSRCEASVAQLDAEVRVTQVECLKAQSDYVACDANNSAKTANGGLLGCAAGVIAAALTGGAAGTLAVMGCGGGLVAGAASQDECGVPPTCTANLIEIEAMVLSKRGLTQRPDCQQPIIQPGLR